MSSIVFFFNDTAPTEIYTLSLHDALPIYAAAARPDRAAWAVQRLLAAAATLSATGSASPRPDRTSWLGGLRRAFSPAFRAGSLYPMRPRPQTSHPGNKWAPFSSYK